MVFTASLLGAQYKRDSVENKPASLFVVFLDKALNGMPPSLCGRQVSGPSSLPSWWPSLTEDSQTEHELLRIVCVLVRFLYVLFSHAFFTKIFIRLDTHIMLCSVCGCANIRFCPQSIVHAERIRFCGQIRKKIFCTYFADKTECLLNKVYCVTPYNYPSRLKFPSKTAREQKTCKIAQKNVLCLATSSQRKKIRTNIHSRK